MPPIVDWDDAYANTPHIPGGEGYPARWAAAAAAFRAGTGGRLREGIAYGSHPRQRFDLFLPEGVPAGLVIFVHGGYWRAFDRGHWSHLAAGPLARGWAVAVPGYVLAPEARIAAITATIREAIAAAAAEVAGPIRLTGHSAGGHLVARQICGDSLLPEAVMGRIERVVPVSGLFDLRPFLRTQMNEALQLDLFEARAESPALTEVRRAVPVDAWVGGDERPEFLRQSALLANVWTGLGLDMRLTVAPGRHHFDVIEGLEDPASPLVEAVVGPVVGRAA
ncbi:alpha/beta hydrolase [Amaricoccus sp.]|uniref:alpha/beta hydrolase n=1 Tax=Amaricoccus sp. TaxID=1872485 RepID=UPI002611D9C2|nr:alpha/beta hydrolase [Amaricoccus sp.]HRO12638.1 alpha/beta hydrolase [Amaricoccus sp.]